MMRQVLKASTALGLIMLWQVGLSRPAEAGSYRAPYIEPELIEPAEVVRPPSFWPGGYVGIGIGIGIGRDRDREGLCPGGLPPIDETEGGPCGPDGRLSSSNGSFAGFHAGYNFRPRADSNFLMGVELDYNRTNMVIVGAATNYHPLSTEWDASLRLRAGYTFDRTFVYVAGGVAAARGRIGYDSQTHVGWTLGLGVEHAFSRHWSARIEARRNDFGAATYQTSRGPIRAHLRYDTIMMGLTYRF